MRFVNLLCNHSVFFTNDFSFSSYFYADVPSFDRTPARLTAQSRGGGRNCGNKGTLCWFLTDILLLVAAADHIP